MREHLYRGKRKDNGEWVYGFIATTELYPFDGSEKAAYIWEIPCVHNCIPVDPETVGEYTGLLDKNGVKIFEGDIVRYWNGTCVEDRDGEIEVDGKCYSRTAEKISVVVFAGSAFRLKDNNPINCFIREQALEVIGDVYGKPELLEVQE